MDKSADGCSPNGSQLFQDNHMKIICYFRKKSTKLIIDYPLLTQMIRQVAWIMLGFNGNNITKQDKANFDTSDFRKYRKIQLEKEWNC